MGRRPGYCPKGKTGPLTEEQAALVASHDWMVGWTVRRWVTWSPGIDLDEIRSRVRVGLIRAAQLFDPGRGLLFSTFAVHWCRQAVTRYFLLQSRQPRRMADLGTATDEGDFGLDPATAEPGPARQAAARELVRRFLRWLHPLERRVLRMRFLQGYHLEEVGDVLGISRERVRQLESRALRKIREREALVVADPTNLNPQQ